MKRRYFEELILPVVWPATWLYFMHEIADSISWSPQCSWQGLVLAKTCPAQWVTLHNNLGLPLCLGRFTSLIVQAPIGRRYFRCSVFACVCTCWVNIVITHNVVTPSLLSQLAYIVCFEHAILPHLAKCCVLRLIPMPHLTISLLLGWCAESPHYTHAHLILNLE